jgi:hypothetical protein
MSASPQSSFTSTPLRITALFTRTVWSLHLLREQQRPARPAVPGHHGEDVLLPEDERCDPNPFPAA